MGGQLVGLRWASAVLLLAGVVGGAPNEPLPRNLSSSKSRTRMAPRGVVSTSQPPATEFAVAAAAGERRIMLPAEGGEAARRTTWAANSSV